MKYCTSLRCSDMDTYDIDTDYSVLIPIRVFQ